MKLITTTDENGAVIEQMAELDYCTSDGTYWFDLAAGIVKEGLLSHVKADICKILWYPGGIVDNQTLREGALTAQATLSGLMAQAIQTKKLLQIYAEARKAQTEQAK